MSHWPHLDEPDPLIRQATLFGQKEPQSGFGLTQVRVLGEQEIQGLLPPF